jgi:hypothetical protein
MATMEIVPRFGGTVSGHKEAIMKDITPTIDRYFALWTEPDEERRRDLIAQTFAEDATYTGPLLGGTGHDGIGQLVTQINDNLGGHRFNRTSDIDSHHDAVRYSWEIVPPDADSPLAAGIDIGFLDEHGRLKSVTAFLDVFPEQVHDAHE